MKNSIAYFVIKFSVRRSYNQYTHREEFILKNKYI